MVITREEETAAMQRLGQEMWAVEQSEIPRARSREETQPMAGEQFSGLFMPAPEVSRIGLRMPEFTLTDPELWFSIIDRSFQASGITVDAIKFGHALTAIGPKYAAEVRDIIMNPPAERAYETLRSELVKRLSLTQEHKTRPL